MPVNTFWLEPTADRVKVSLRRFSYSADAKCVKREWGCDSEGAIAPDAPQSDWPNFTGDHSQVVAHDDPRWPTTCELCGRLFLEEDQWQIRVLTLYQAADGRRFTLQEAPPGAMWNAVWMRSPGFQGPDGRCLVVRLPNGHDWLVDSQSSNCTRPGEPHQCWVRHGNPETGNVHVDKDGDTCAAGAGSIQSGSYHGFLHHGALTDA